MSSENDRNCRCQILVVEDDPDIRETLADVLRLEGYPVLTAENGSDAISLLRTCEIPCLILLDLMMPIMNGWEFLDAVKTQHHKLATIPVVVVSAAGDRAQGLQSTGFLKKPVEIDALLSTVARYCAKPQVQSLSA